MFLLPDAGGDRLLHMSGVAMNNIRACLNKLIETKRREPDDSFTSFVLNATIDGRQFSEEEARGAMVINALGSGHTVASHLGYVFYYLAQHPELQRRVPSEPELGPKLGEELLQVYSLFGHARVVTRDADFHGVRLHQGDQVFIMYSMPNRDPRVAGFDEIDPDRDRNPHLAFNFGPRRCIGRHWARISRQVALEEWHNAIPEYRLKPGANLVEQIYAGTGYRTLPLTWSV